MGKGKPLVRVEEQCGDLTIKAVVPHNRPPRVYVIEDGEVLDMLNESDLRRLERIVRVGRALMDRAVREAGER